MSLRSELDSLQAEINAGQKPGGHNHTAEATQGANETDAAEIARLLQEVQDFTAEAREDAADFVTAHPLASVTSALLLGFLLGWTLGRTS